MVTLAPKIEFQTSELTLEQAHVLVDAAYAGQQAQTHVEPIATTSSEEETRQAKELLTLSESPSWRALLATLQRDGEAHISDVAARVGVSSRGLQVAVGRAVKGDYRAYAWSWIGRGDSQIVKVGPGLQAALASQDDVDMFDVRGDL